VVPQDVARQLEIELIADPGQDHCRLDRLDDVIDGAERQAVLLVSRIAERGQEDHRGVARRGVLPQGGKDRVAVHLRHHDVEQDQVRHRQAGGDLKRAPAARGDQDIVTRLQKFPEYRKVLRLIVDNQQGCACDWRGHGSAPVFIGGLDQDMGVADPSPWTTILARNGLAGVAETFVPVAQRSAHFSFELLVVPGLVEVFVDRATVDGVGDCLDLRVPR
jgi:hypothetical protein